MPDKVAHSMLDWPRFSRHLYGEASPHARVLSLLSELAEPAPAPSAADVLSLLFDDPRLVAEIAALAPRVHHVGFIAPCGVDVAAVEALLAGSPFHAERRTCESMVLAKELSARIGREVGVTLVKGSAAPQRSWCPAVEIFVAELPAPELDELVAREIGCHLALGVDRESSLDRLRDVLHAHGRSEIPLMRRGALSNHALRASLLYVDVARRGRSLRLELIASH